MKKILFTLLAAWALPMMLLAQSADDDLYFVPSKKKVEKKETRVRVESSGPVRVETQGPVRVESSSATVVTSAKAPTVVVRDRKKNTRDVDSYNRRYDSSDYNFSSTNDTLYIDERSSSDLRGEWVNGFDGSADDYEYATRIIRFQNPRYAIPVSSPLYFDEFLGLERLLRRILRLRLPDLLQPTLVGLALQLLWLELGMELGLLVRTLLQLA